MSEDELIARQTFAAGVRLALARLDGNRATIAGRFGVSIYTIDKWRQGTSLPNPLNLARLARYSGLTQEQIRTADLDA